MDRKKNRKFNVFLMDFGKHFFCKEGGFDNSKNL